MLNLNYPAIGDMLILQSVAEDEQKRWEVYKRAWQAYKGELPDALKVDMGLPNDNVKISKARIIVDTSVAFLFGQNVQFELDDTTECALYALLLQPPSSMRNTASVLSSSAAAAHCADQCAGRFRCTGVSALRVHPLVGEASAGPSVMRNR